MAERAGRCSGAPRPPGSPDRCARPGLGVRRRWYADPTTGWRAHPANRPGTSRTEEGVDMSGEMDQAKGRVKQATGDLTGDDEMKREGEADEAAGKLKDKVDDAKDGVNDAIDKLRGKD